MPATNRWFCASGADGKNISICAAIISSSGRPKAISKPTNNQLFYFTFGFATKHLRTNTNVASKINWVFHGDISEIKATYL
jgi:hypothetical protein